MLVFFLLATLFFSACKQKPVQDPTDTEYTLLPAPDWSADANIYEVNIRQYTPEGTFNAFATHLPRLKEMGVEILWLMPIHPISEKNRKGGLGSYYAVRDYKDVNPDFGSKEDFRKLVEEAHALEMKVIIDWVPNHTGFDNVWIDEHPDWYTQNDSGQIIHPAGTDWTDVADLNYDNAGMRAAMTDAMSYWVTDFGIDGYRCDVAGEVPNDFWKANNSTLFSKKHVFMLAEWDDPSLHEAGFHMTYGWGFHHVLNQIAKGEITLTKVDSFLTADEERYPKEAYRMNFITNHDENSWNGTISERMGPAADALAVFAFTVDGMPLIYSGQEAGLSKRLAFFEKDTISWEDMSKSAFYQKLLRLKQENAALWNGIHGGTARKLTTDKDDQVYAFTRELGDKQVVVLLNLSAKKQEFTLMGSQISGSFEELFDESKMDFSENTDPVFTLAPWAYKVFAK